MLNKYFYNDYSDYYIEEKINYNACRKPISTQYKLKIAKYRFGFKNYFYYYEWVSCWSGDCFKHIVNYESKENLINHYQTFKVDTKTNRLTEKICN